MFLKSEVWVSFFFVEEVFGHCFCFSVNLYSMFIFLYFLQCGQKKRRKFHQLWFQNFFIAIWFVSVLVFWCVCHCHFFFWFANFKSIRPLSTKIQFTQKQPIVRNWCVVLIHNKILTNLFQQMANCRGWCWLIYRTKLFDMKGTNKIGLLTNFSYKSSKSNISIYLFSGYLEKGFLPTFTCK